MSIEVTVFVPFTYEDEAKELLIEGTAEIYGGEDDYDVVALRDKDGNRIAAENSFVFRAIRSQLLQEQYVFDTLREEIDAEVSAHINRIKP